MAVTGISTKSIFTGAIDDIKKNQVDLATVTNQISSGNAQENYNELVGDIGELNSLETEIAKLESYSDAINSTITELNIADSTIGNLIDLATQLRSDTVLRSTPSGASLNLEEIGTNALSQIGELLNTQVRSKYIFAGSKTDTPPVNSNVNIVANYDDANASTFTTNTNYFVGDTNINKLRVSDGLVVDVGTTANKAAFSNFIAAAHLAVEGHRTNDDGLFAKAIDLLSTAIDQLTTEQTDLGFSIAALKDSKVRHEDAITSLEVVASDIKSTDIVEASIRVSFNETVLQATFQAFARISGLRLVDFLR